MTNQTTVMKNAGVIARASAMALVDNLKFIKGVQKAEESDWNGKNEFKAGNTIYINKPARFIPNTQFDATSSLLDFVEETVPLTLNNISSVPMSLASNELATDINLSAIVKRIVKPAVADIAMNVESTALSQVLPQVYNQVGTAGSTTYDTNTILGAGTLMNKYLTPTDDDRTLLLESIAGQAAVNERKGLFQSSTEIAKQYKNGLIGSADGFNWVRNELLPVHTNGTASVTQLTVTTTSTDGDAVLAITDGSGGAHTLTAGTRFTIAGVYAVHPVTKVVYPFLQQFTVLANATASSGAFAAVSISPTLHYTAKPSLQNVSALPQSSAAITVLSGAASTSYQTGLAFHKNAFRFASVPLVQPTAVEFSAMETYEGVTVNIVRAFDVYKRTMVTRMDVLWGICVERPEFACALTA